LVADQEATGSSPVGRTTDSLYSDEKPPVHSERFYVSGDLVTIWSQVVEMSGTTIAITDNATNRPKKITKIIPYTNGGFAVLAPYHKARIGYVMKFPVDYSKRLMKVSRAEMVEYSVADRVKLSVHPDGFVQFSGENPGKVLSGRDVETGAPKGMGLMVNPLYTPVRAGPTFGVVAWGLHDFESLRASEAGNALLFSEDDFYYRLCTPDDWNAYLIEAFVFTDNDWAGVRNRDGKFTLTRAFPEFDAHFAVLDLRLVRLPNQPIFLGIIVSRTKVDFGSPSGFCLAGPTDRKHGLQAMYPPPMKDPPSARLDYSLVPDD